MDDSELGARIAYWREQRGVTQRLLADRIGRSKSWIEKVEAGKRSASRLPVLLTICGELRIDLPVLIGRDLTRSTRECIDDVQVEMIRGALERYDASGYDSAEAGDCDLSKLRRQVTYVWSASELADFQVVGRTLPGLILDAQRAHVAAGSEDTRRLLTEVYQITSSTLRKLGEYDLAWLAGDRGISLAEQTGDSVLAALTGTRVANALVAIGRVKAALDLNVSLVSRIEASLRTEAEMSVYGHLLLQAAMAAAHDGDAFDEAGVRALRRERRASHLVDVARGYSQWGMRADALAKLLEAEAPAPREVICRPMARGMISNLIERERGQPSGALQALAERAGVAA